ncbi:unnamed protein product [Fusarium fujikuroi]|uniref:Uncharacterized protein n=1 Tax=Fusarium fujikuroi TaxID=5127 RepID=A0A9Q7VSA1_FUSFU|nr:uncharacterized protein FFB14_13961 [Fusarium fujikuroi]VTT75597.1 unnamed protein product [Fusarium fujikuroi]VTT82516.1 unnamed protein product [Fusarium fujikuroi]VZH98457.1 unnamed protein product [Fusarium fujikuroi]
MWQFVPGDPEVRRERVRPGEWNLEKEAEKPGQGVWRTDEVGTYHAPWHARLEPIQARDPVMLRGSGSIRRRVFLVQVQVRLALDSLKDHGGGYEKTGQGFGQPRWTQVRRGSISAHRKRREGQQGSVKQHQVNIGYPIAKTWETGTSRSSWQNYRILERQQLI